MLPINFAVLSLALVSSGAAAAATLGPRHSSVYEYCLDGCRSDFKECKATTGGSKETVVVLGKPVDWYVSCIHLLDRVSRSSAELGIFRSNDEEKFCRETCDADEQAFGDECEQDP